MRKGYPEYKDTKFEWLGPIPSHWELAKIGVLFDQRNEKVSDTDFPALSVTKKGIVPQLENAAKTDAGDNRKLVLKGDFVINSRSDRKGSSGVSSLDGSVSLISIVIRPLEHNPRYIHHLFRSYNFQEEFYRYGKGIVADLWSTRYSEMKNIYIPVLPIEEQNSIADYLDKETSRIDSLISEKNNFVNLLKEKRQGLISSSVTKGLDPSVEMKDSRIDWVGEIPSHWSSCKLKHKTLLITDGAHISPVTDNGKHYFVSIRDIKNDTIDFENSLLTSQDSYDYLVRSGCKPEAGDILFSKDGTVGKTVVVPENKDFVVASSLIIIRPNKKEVIPEYFDLVCKSNLVQDQISNFIRGAALKRLSIANLLKISAVFPPISEQEDILASILPRLQKIDMLIEEVNASIKLLRDHRVALISAAVTGKIDLRDKEVA